MLLIELLIKPVFRIHSVESSPWNNWRNLDQIISSFSTAGFWGKYPRKTKDIYHFLISKYPSFWQIVSFVSRHFRTPQIPWWMRGWQQWRRRLSYCNVSGIRSKRTQWSNLVLLWCGRKDLQSIWVKSMISSEFKIQNCNDSDLYFKLYI